MIQLKDEDARAIELEEVVRSCYHIGLLMDNGYDGRFIALARIHIRQSLVTPSFCCLGLASYEVLV